ncbi:MAG TPA: SDR family NAD(P)-dependent oxidoreductase [Aeromicrobium sp.]|nr:SDR family NAD(P)-dependent oxidoreductase [Aeromicrobium sp.]
MPTRWLSSPGKLRHWPRHHPPVRPRGRRRLVTGRREAELDAMVAKIEADGGRAAAIVGNVKDETLAERLVDAAVTRFGGLDIAFNNAGVTGEVGPVAHLTVQGWRDTRHQPDGRLSRRQVSGAGDDPARRRLDDLHLDVRGALRRLPRYGRYAASKAGLIGLTRPWLSSWRRTTCE